MALVGSLNGVWTTKLVNNNASYPLLQSLTAYIFIFFVYCSLYLFFYLRNRHRKFSNFVFFERPWKYAILGFIDMEANFAAFKAFQYTDMVSVQLLLCLTIPCVLVLSFFILKMRFTITHIVGCIIAVGGAVLMIVLDADGVSRSAMGSDVVKGNLLAVLSATLYGVSNVLAEWFMKPQIKEKKVSFSDLEEVQEVENGVMDGDDNPSVGFAPQGVKVDNNEGTAHAHISKPAVSVDAPLQEEEGELPVVAVYIPLLETLCCMSGCAIVFCVIQFFAIEWSVFSPQRAAWTNDNWFYQIMFGLSMLFFYAGSQTLFLIASATFANVSLLAATVYSIIWNVTIFGIYPTALFFASYVMIIVGVVMYNLSDVHWSWCPTVNYICGEPRSVVALKKGDVVGVA